VVDASRKAKREYLERRLDSNKGEPKQMWRLLKEMLKGISNNAERKELQCENRIVNNVKEMAEEFNRYFVSSITQLAEGNDADDLPIEIAFEHSGSVFEQFDRVHECDLRNMVGKLVNKAGTEEGITVKIMKLVMKAAGEKVCHIINRLLQESIVPERWKEAIVIPIPKIRGKSRVNEFRPINKLPAYEKILEMVVHNQLMRCLESNELIAVCQSGFRSGHSCETALQWVLTDLKNAIGDRQMIGVVFLDLKRAFKVVDRNVLLKKLQRYGLRAAVLEWSKCYLENRSQRVKFNGVLSEPMDVNFGVPQRSVLGPLLFLLYINDITEVMTADCSIRFFADDALIYATGSSREEINERLNEQMIRVDDWLNRNRLYPNVSKTKAMLIRGIRRKVAEQDFKVKSGGKSWRL